MKRLVVLIALVAAAVVAALRTRSDDARAGHGATASAQREAPADGPAQSAAPELARPGPSDVEADEPGDARSAVEAPDAPLAEAPAADAKQRLEGRVVVVDEFGAEHAEEDGSLTLILWRGNSGAHEEVAVEGGRWSAEVDPIERLGIGEISLGGRGAVLEKPRAELAFDPGPVLLRARWPSALTLHVRDAESGAPLDGVRVRATRQAFQSSNDYHPSGVERLETLVEHGVSPIRLEPGAALVQARQLHLYVHSPGYAWSHAILDAASGEERVVELAPGGGLVATILGSTAGVRAALRLRSGTDGVPVVSEPVPAAGRIELEGLKPGAYRATVEVGEWYSDPILLADGEVEVEAGRSAELRLEVDAAPPPPRVPLSGVLHLPAEYELERFWISFELSGTTPDGSDGRAGVHSRDMISVEGEPGSFAWDAGPVHQGRYTATVDRLQYSVGADVGPHGLTDWRIDVPPPGRIEVEVVDAASGERLHDARVMWNCKPAPGSRGWSSTGAERDDASGLFRIVAPQGAVMLSASGDGYAYGRPEEVLLGAEPRQVRLELERACRIEFRMREGERELPWQVDWRPDPEPLGHDGRAVSSSRSGDMRGVQVDLPGRYRFTLPEIPGFEPLEPVIVDVRAGATVEHVIQVVRKR